METIRVRVHIVGLVQGVYYRNSTRQRARELGLSGWVRNAHDGSVWVEAQGVADDVAKLVQWCRVGPPAARVDSVVTQSMSSLRDEDQFEIHY